MPNNCDAKPRIKAVIFDLDGTLVDSEPNYYFSDKRLLAEYGINLTEEMKRKYIGIGSKEMMKDVKAIYDIKDSVDELIVRKNIYYEELARVNSKAFPEMEKFVKMLIEHGYPVAIASGSSPQVIDLVTTVTDLKQYFQVFVSAEEVPRGKPYPDIFLDTAEKLGIAPENCLVLEDSQYGVEAAKSASMYCVAVPEGFEETMPESFMSADLLYKKGIAEFSAEKTFNWMRTFA